MIDNKIIEIISNVLNWNQSEELNLYSNITDLEIDSIKFVEIVVEIEKIFYIEFEDEALLYTKFSDIQSIIEYVKLRISITDK